MKRVAFTLLCSVVLSSSAVAQDTEKLAMDAYSSGPWLASADPVYLAAMKKYGSCAAGSNRFQSNMVLSALPESKASFKALFWMLLGSNSCAGTDRTPDAAPRYYRGIVAEYFFKKHFAGSVAKGKPQVQRVYDEPKAEKLAKLSAETVEAVAMIRFGQCVSTADPAGVLAVFETHYGSAEERAALAAIGPSRARCLEPGSIHRMNPFQLRSYLAEGAYRRAASELRQRKHA